MTTPPRKERTRWPRGMRPATAAEYCDMSPSTFRQICPVKPSRPTPRIVLYDRAAIDAWLDSIQDGEAQIEGSRSDGAGYGWDDLIDHR